MCTLISQNFYEIKLTQTQTSSNFASCVLKIICKHSLNILRVNHCVHKNCIFLYWFKWRGSRNWNISYLIWISFFKNPYLIGILDFFLKFVKWKVHEFKTAQLNFKTRISTKLFISSICFEHRVITLWFRVSFLKIYCIR